MRKRIHHANLRREARIRVYRQEAIDQIRRGRARARPSRGLQGEGVFAHELVRRGHPDNLPEHLVRLGQIAAIIGGQGTDEGDHLVFLSAEVIPERSIRIARSVAHLGPRALALKRAIGLIAQRPAARA